MCETTDLGSTNPTIKKLRNASRYRPPAASTFPLLCMQKQITDGYQIGTCQCRVLKQFLLCLKCQLDRHMKKLATGSMTVVAALFVCLMEAFSEVQNEYEYEYEYE
ncbi:hypothetical protein B0I72DRAFT_128204 [Yarrowia lipolytica]|nr:hypothetical protein B0I72DRAFT_128204 [Yarrowia lipolytica]